jgi:hypothetical protein
LTLEDEAQRLAGRELEGPIINRWTLATRSRCETKEGLAGADWPSVVFARVFQPFDRPPSRLIISGGVVLLETRLSRTVLSVISSEHPWPHVPSESRFIVISPRSIILSTTLLFDNTIMRHKPVELSAKGQGLIGRRPGPIGEA